MEVLVIREENVKEILSGLNSGKSCGPDGIHPRLLQELSDILCTPLLQNTGNEDVNIICWEWFQTARSQNIRLRDPNLS